jgi:hypothetical protein
VLIITGIITARKGLAAFYKNIFLILQSKKKSEMQKYQKIFDFLKFLQILNLKQFEKFQFALRIQSITASCYTT